MLQILARDVRARGPHMSSRQRLDEITAGPLEDGASHQVDLARGFGLRVSNERDQATVWPEARNDVHMVREHCDLVYAHRPAGPGFVDDGTNGVSIGAANEPLSQPRVPGDVDVQSECPVSHGHRSADPGATPRGNTEGRDHQILK